jgi:hypothetical protein
MCPKRLEKRLNCSQIDCMKTVTYALRLDQELYEKVGVEADKRKKKLSEMLRDLITYGFKALPPLPDTPEVVADTWEKLGPAPDVAYDKL